MCGRRSRRERPLPLTPDNIHELVSAGDAAGLARALRFAETRDEVRSAHFGLVSLGEAAVAPLVTMLGDDLSERGQRAWWTLMRIGEPAQEQLTETLRASRAPAARAAAAWVLGHLGDPGADRHLVRALDDADDRVKLPAALLVGFRGCSEAVPALLRILTRGRYDDPAAPHPDQLALPLEGLGVYGEVVGQEALPSWDPAASAGIDEQLALFPEDCAAEEPMPPVDDLDLRDDAATEADEFELFLAELGETFSSADFPVCGAVDQLIPSWVVLPWCHWDAQDLREAVVLSLGRIADPRAVEALIECVNDKAETPLLRQMAVAALGVIADERAFETVHAALRDDDLEAEALSALGGFSDRRVLAPLVAALQTTDYRRMSAVSGLVAYTDPAALPYLCGLTYDEDGHVVCRAFEGLARLGSQPALEAIARQLTNQSPVIRRQAAAALAWAQRVREAGEARMAGEAADADDADSTAPIGSVWHP